MRVRFIPHFGVVPFALLFVGSMLAGGPRAWTQDRHPAAPTSGGLFPDPAPVVVQKASLRGLLDILKRKDAEAAGPMIWQLLAAMFKARELGTGPSEFLAAGYRAERLKGSDAADVQNCLLSAWAGAQTLALLVPENIALMERGTAPRATRGMERGQPVNFDLENLPAVIVTTKVPPKAIAVATPLSAREPVAAPPSIVVKTLDVRLNERVPLDAFGLRNMDFRLDSVDPHGSVAFLFVDRTGNHFGRAEHWNSPNRLNREMAFSDGISRLTTFSPELIPDTTTRGVKLLTLPFGAVYLDEDIGVQLNFHLVIRVASEALMYDQLPPEKQKLYEIQSPP